MEAHFKAIKKEAVMKHPAVLATIKKAREMNPGRSLPKTTGNSELVRRFLETIGEMAYTPFIGARDALLGCCEVVGGERVSELCGAQTGHGVLANDMAIVTWEGGEGLKPPPRVAAGDVFVEHLNDTSKTELGRVICVRGESRGPARVRIEAALRRYWRVAKLPMAAEVRAGGWLVERPNFWVIQVGLHALRFDEALRDSLSEWLVATKVRPVHEVGARLATELKRLLGAQNPVESMMFLNVLGGPLTGDASMTLASRELTERGIAFTLQKGPLLMKTSGVRPGRDTKGRRLSVVLPMPILAKSTYDLMNRVLNRVYDEMVASGHVDLQLGGDRTEPSWGHYTWRRLAAEAAQATLARGECKEEDVDLHMGWRLAKWAKQMRLHYSDRGVRTARAHLTEGI